MYPTIPVVLSSTSITSYAQSPSSSLSLSISLVGHGFACFHCPQSQNGEEKHRRKKAYPRSRGPYRPVVRFCVEQQKVCEHKSQTPVTGPAAARRTYAFATERFCKPRGPVVPAVVAFKGVHVSRGTREVCIGCFVGVLCFFFTRLLVASVIRLTTVGHVIHPVPSLSP